MSPRPFLLRPTDFFLVRKMEEQFGFEHASALVFASGLPNQMLTNALNRRGACWCGENI